MAEPIHARRAIHGEANSRPQGNSWRSQFTPEGQFIFTKRPLCKNPLRLLTNTYYCAIILLKNNAYERIKK
jgi:hypothetical protein